MGRNVVRKMGRNVVRKMMRYFIALEEKANARLTMSTRGNTVLNRPGSA